MLDCQVLGDDNDYITINPPVNGISKYFGNRFRDEKVPPKIINFPRNTAVQICFKSGSIVHGHPGFRAELTEKPTTDWITSPNYPENMNGANSENPPAEGYSAGINQCWVRVPVEGNYWNLEFFQFDVGC